MTEPARPGTTGGRETPDPVARLSLDQKASLTSGSGMWHLQPAEEAGVPAIRVADGPHGLRRQPDGNPLGLGDSLPATCFPPAVTLACTWDTGLLRRVGEALGREARAQGVSVLLGPGVNIKRSPLCGRNFEYFSEDPFLTGRLAAAYVLGVQAQGVGTSVKHFAANNQETDRQRVSADVDERTLREIYLAAFEHVVTTARPATVMAAYNKVNGVYAAEHRGLLTDVLRGEWGFDGVVLSDWGAVVDRVRSLAAGLDVEMPPSGTDDEVAAAVRDGRLDAGHVDAAARRVVRLAEATAAARAEPGTFDAGAHHDLARTAAAAGAVLLKNDGDLLPLDPHGTGRIAVIGEFARTPRYQGAGSSLVVPTRLDSALDAIVAVAGDRVDFAPGFTLDGEPDPALAEEAARVARGAGTAVVFLGLPSAAETEGRDRTGIDLPAGQLAVLAAVSDANPRTVVVLSNGAVVSVAPWRDRAAAILETWLAGQAGGTAVADMLFGAAEPGGRLAETIPLRLEDTPSHLYFPGAERHVRYGEGVYVGYRHHDTLGRPVAYPFGHGLGYTTFELTGLAATTEGNTCEVSAEVANTGARRGSQVIQVYVHVPRSAVDRPVHELKGFAKVTLDPGETRRVTVTLDERAFAHWSIAGGRWRVEPGTAEIRAGFSSRDIRARCRVELPGDDVPAALDAMSTLDEWLADPVGAALVTEAMGPLLAPREREGLDLRAVLGSMPLLKLARLGAGVTVEGVSDLVRRHREAVARG